ncbi:7367_t:CDS:2 [Acaulospora colombiana]|uniref:7367_t:CDS:1 n=1 Tax=Acaulospora colombiana TaxID=27376 RepID=A0ACA9MGK4_9GLOM|nr:7367_t:CDS:2 [Acaulospora colombiana]
MWITTSTHPLLCLETLSRTIRVRKIVNRRWHAFKVLPLTEDKRTLPLESIEVRKPCISLMVWVRVLLEFVGATSGESATIHGTPSQREQAKVLINEILSKLVYAPTVGFTLLKVSGIERSDARYRFVEFAVDNDLINVQRYRLEKVKRTPREGANANERMDSAMDRNAELLSNGFNTIDKFNQCIRQISSKLEFDDSHLGNGLDPNLRQIQYHIFFGRQTFTKVDPQRVFGVADFCKFDRHTKNNISGVSTSFSHSTLPIWQIFERTCGKFGLKLDVSKKDKQSISILYMHDGHRRKMKLCWSKEEGLWKIDKLATNVRRHAIIDIVTGTESPDLRFMVKTQSTVLVEPELERVIRDLQAERLIPGEKGMWFDLKDFRGTLDCVGIRQKITKKCYINDKFKITTVTTQQEINGQNDNKITMENHITLKSHCWRRRNGERNKSPRMKFDDEVASGSIHEAIRFASEIAKSIC